MEETVEDCPVDSDAVEYMVCVEDSVVDLVVSDGV